MVLYECLGKQRDKNERIVKYALRRYDSNEITVIGPEQLKSEIKSGAVKVTNLKLTQDNRLIDKVITEVTKPITVLNMGSVFRDNKSVIELATSDFKLVEIELEKYINLKQNGMIIDFKGCRNYTEYKIIRAELLKIHAFNKSYILDYLDSAYRSVSNCKNKENALVATLMFNLYQALKDVKDIEKFIYYYRHIVQPLEEKQFNTEIDDVALKELINNKDFIRVIPMLGIKFYNDMLSKDNVESVLKKHKLNVGQLNYYTQKLGKILPALLTLKTINKK